MSEERNTQGNESIVQKIFNAKNVETAESWLNKADQFVAPVLPLFMYLGMAMLGFAFVRFLMVTELSQDVYYKNLFAGMGFISLAIVALSFWDSMKRNEIPDTIWVVVAIALNYAAINFFGTWGWVQASYGIGFWLAHKASRNGKLDWTPLVAYNAAYIGLASHVFGSSAASVALPVLMGVLYEVTEIVRTRNYQAVRLAYPGMAIALVGMFVTTNPIIWVLVGATVSFIGVPTAVKLYHKKYSKGGSWLKSCAEPFKDCDNGLNYVRVNGEAAMLTLVTSTLMMIIMVIIF
jgi:hypothetical protein